jgi:hypothetical protein
MKGYVIKRNSHHQIPSGKSTCVLVSAVEESHIQWNPFFLELLETTVLHDWPMMRIKYQSTKFQGTFLWIHDGSFKPLTPSVTLVGGGNPFSFPHMGTCIRTSALPYTKYSSLYSIFLSFIDWNLIFPDTVLECGDTWYQLHCQEPLCFHTRSYFSFLLL